MTDVDKTGSSDYQKSYRPFEKWNVRDIIPLKVQ